MLKIRKLISDHKDKCLKFFCCFMFRRVHLSVESFSRSLFVIPGEGVKDATLGEILLVCMLSFRF